MCDSSRCGKGGKYAFSRPWPRERERERERDDDDYDDEMMMLIKGGGSNVQTSLSSLRLVRLR